MKEIREREKGQNNPVVFYKQCREYIPQPDNCDNWLSDKDFVLCLQMPIQVTFIVTRAATNICFVESGIRIPKLPN